MKTAARMHVSRGIGCLSSMWCERPRVTRATKDQARILAGTLKMIMKFERRPLDGTVLVAKGVLRRAK